MKILAQTHCYERFPILLFILLCTMHLQGVGDHVSLQFLCPLLLLIKFIFLPSLAYSAPPPVHSSSPGKIYVTLHCLTEILFGIKFSKPSFVISRIFNCLLLRLSRSSLFVAIVFRTLSLLTCSAHDILSVLL